MPVDGEPVVRIALRAAADIGPPGHEPLERTDTIEHIQGRDSPLAAADERQERVARPCIPGDGRRDRRSRDGVDEHGCDRAVRGGKGLEHVGRSRQRRRRARARPRDRPRQGRADDGVDRPRVLEDRPHQPVDRGQPRFVVEPHARCDLGLDVGGQPVDPFPRLELHGASRAHEELLRFVDRGEIRVPDDAGPVQGLADRAREPPQCRDVAQAAEPILEVRRQVGRARAGRRGAPHAVLLDLVRERRRIADHLGDHRVGRRAAERRRARDHPPVEHRGAGVQPFPGRFDTLGRRPDERRDRPALVPQRIPEPLAQLGEHASIHVVVHEQHVDVGARKLQPASVPAEREECDATGDALERVHEPRVESVGTLPGRPTAVLARWIRARERIEPSAELRGIRHRSRGRRGPSRRCGSAPRGRRR